MMNGSYDGWLDNRTGVGILWGAEGRTGMKHIKLKRFICEDAIAGSVNNSV